MISDSNSSSVESNLNINNTYNLVNDDFNRIDFGDNDISNFKAVLLSSESWSRG
jgi:hypothetical protein